jgi:hypothetical protein
MTHYTPTPIHAGNRVIGKVSGNTFYKHIRGSVHILRTPRAIALDVGSLEQAERAGAVNVQVTDTETGTAYRSSIEHIRRAGFDLDRGFGSQIALPIEGWATIRRGDVFGEQLKLI